MPGFLGGSSGSGTGGEIRFPAELIDPVTKLRVSEPQTLIDTDFEYGLQPTKWETVELINNTPSFFSKSGDTTIPNIEAISTTAVSREIKVTTSLAHGLAVGIPINVSGTKSLTADGAYIINSVPTPTTFTYLCKQNQPDAASIEDLYTSIVSGEFFQGSQIKIAESDGIVTDAAGSSTLTVKTESPHGFGLATPFYFLNLNSTVSQEFDSSNTSSKAFDSANSSTAQVFDGSNTLTSYRLDLDNNAVSTGTVSSISTFSPVTNQITVAHTTENFVGLGVGSPLYHNITTAGGYFSTSPRGVVFLKSLDTSNTTGAIFTVSAVPNGTVIAIPNAITGTFQKANEARLFAGNNTNTATETTINVVEEAEKTFNGSNTGGQFLNNCSFSGSNVSGASGSGIADLDLYQGLMVKYETTGTPPTINAGGSALFGGSTTALVNNRTYFIESSFQVGSSINYVTTLKEFPTSTTNINFTSAGSGTHKFTVIGIATDKEMFHIKNHGYAVNDMLRYTYPAGARFTVNDVGTELKDYYFVQNLYGPHNFDVNWTVGETSPKLQEFIGLVATQSSVTTIMNAVGFGAGLTFSVTSGTLPTGLSLNTTTGVITGTPSNIAGYPTQTVRITAVDSANSTDFVDITFQVNPAPYLFAFTSATFTPGGGDSQVGPNITQARNGVGNPSWAAQYLNMPRFNGIMEWTVPRTATYRITAQGAGGNYDNCYGYSGGQGANMRGDFALTQGQILTMAIGQRGRSGCSSQGCGHSTSGGNGATWVIRGALVETASQSDVAVIAGGGGPPGVYPCCDGSNYTSNANVGTSGNWNNARGGGAADGGNGAGSWSGHADGGSGFFNAGSGGADRSYGPSQYRTTSTPLRGGTMSRNWGDYGHVGGFGGGGGGGLHSGGSAGWSGGGAGQWCSYLAGGGGGSLNNGSNQNNFIGGGNTDGYITITQL
jgi:hypothetical protein